MRSGRYLFSSLTVHEGMERNRSRMIQMIERGRRPDITYPATDAVTVAATALMIPLRVLSICISMN